MELNHWDIIGKYFSGEASKEEIEYIENWRRRDATNEQEFGLLSGIDNYVPKDSHNLYPDTEKGIEQVYHKLQFDKQELEIKTIPYSFKRQLFNFKKLAAVLLILISIGLIIKYLTNNQNKQNNFRILATNNQNPYLQDTLPDGSIVYLNINSSIKYKPSLDGQFREVFLIGEAYFNITHDENRPFIVQINGASIKVLGTSFNVNAYESKDNIEVTVISGKVKLENNSKIDDANQNLILESGFKGIIEKKLKSVVKEQNTNKECLNWRKHHIIFKETSLKEVSKILNELYFVNIQFEGEKLNNEKLTAKFEDQTISSILKVIKGTFNLQLKNDSIVFLLK